MKRVVKVKTRTCTCYVDLEAICLFYVGEEACEWKVCFEGGHHELQLTGEEGLQLLEAWTEYHNADRVELNGSSCGSPTLFAKG